MRNRTVSYGVRPFSAGHRTARPTVLAWMLLAATASVLPGGWPRAAAQAPGGPEPILWRDPEFTIPFRVRVDPSDPEAPAEIWLYVSTDHGHRWSHVATDDPQTGRFVFRAPRDGDYWFSLRTVDRHGTVRPAGAHRPELRVTVDSQPPRIELGGQRTAVGEVHVHWNATDPHLKADSLTVQYRYDTDPYWQPLIATPAAPDRQGPAIGAAAGGPPGQAARSPTGELTGQAAWHPPATARAVIVRASVEDRAGNSASDQVRITLGKPAPVDRPETVSRFASTGNMPAPHTGSDLWLAGRKPGAEGSDVQQSEEPGYAWVADRASDVPLDRWLAHRTGPLVGDDDPAVTAAGAGPLAARAGTIGPAEASASGAWRPANRPGDARAARRADAGEGPADGRSAAAARPEAVRASAVRAVRGKTFEIQYAVPAGQVDREGRIEVWATANAGQSWRPVEAARVAPRLLRVSVAGEGLYGFRIVWVDRDGRGAPAPVPGDRPDLWIFVDQTPPLARIVSVDVSTDGDPGTLEICWEASDRRLAAHPIGLFYRWKNQQAWAPIAAGLENSGRFVWRTGLQSIGTIEIRLDVEDFAGNVTTVRAVRAAEGANGPILHAPGHLFRNGAADRSARRRGGGGA